MKVDEFLSIAPMFADEDGTRKELCTSFRYGHNLFVTDGRIALVGDATSLDADYIHNTADVKQQKIGDRLLKKHIEPIWDKIDSGAYCEYDLYDVDNAVCEVFASIEPEMMYLRTHDLDPESLDNNVTLDSVRHVHDKFSVVIMANPARSVISGYYASLIAGLVKYYGPVHAYADKDNPHAELYFRGNNWHCVLMPRRVDSIGSSNWDCYLGCSIADAEIGELVHRRGSTINIDALRFYEARSKQEGGAQ